jgi:hypothetical protein
VKLVKKLLGENETEAVLQRLDRLTLDEARTTAEQTLEVVYGLMQNMRVVIDGEKRTRIQVVCSRPLSSFPVDGDASIDSVRDVLGKFCWRYKPIRCLTES